MATGTLQPRTDEQRLAGAPFQISVGGVRRDVRPLSTTKREQWSQMLVGTPLDRFGTLSLNFAAEDGTLSLGAVKDWFAVATSGIPNLLRDLVFEYVHLADPTVGREEFADTVTDEEVEEAILTMLAVSFPIYRRLGRQEAATKLVTHLLSTLGISLRLPDTNGGSAGTSSGSGPTSKSG